MTASDPPRDRLLLGALCVLGATLMFALAGMSIKLAAGALPSESIVFWRNVVSLLILAPWALLHRRRCFRRDNMKLITGRALAVLASLYCYYYSVALIPFADAVLLNFSSPLFVPLLGLLLFRLPLDRVVQLAVVIGFLGVAIILQPGTGVFQPAAVVGLLFGGLLIISAGAFVIRSRRRRRPPESLQRDARAAVAVVRSN